MHAHIDGLDIGEGWLRVISTAVGSILVPWTLPLASILDTLGGTCFDQWIMRSTCRTTMHSGSCNIIIRLCSFTSEVCLISVRNSRSDTAEIVSLQCSPLLFCKGKPIAPESRNGPASRAKGKVLSTNRKHNPEPALPCDRPAKMHAFDKRFEHLWCCCCPGHCYVSSSHVLSGSAAGQ